LIKFRPFGFRLIVDSALEVSTDDFAGFYRYARRIMETYRSTHQKKSFEDLDMET
jgi:hypothetical protein